MRDRADRVATDRLAPRLASARRSQRATAKLRPLLNRVAEIAIDVGLSVDDITHFIRLSFIEAAQPHSRLRNGRSNISQLAAATGMTRPQVAATVRLLNRTQAGVSIETWSNSRSIRVARKWHERIARSRRRSQWTLPYAGQKSFSEIVECSAGDVPPRAMLQELSRLGWVRYHEPANEVSLLLQFDGSIDERGRFQLSLQSRKSVE
jgi:hypothetical protein